MHDRPDFDGKMTLRMGLDANTEPFPVAPHWLFPVVLLLALGFQGIAVFSFSLTNDEPVHLLAGYQSLKLGTVAINLEHPPLPKLIAATPLLLEPHIFTLPSRAASAARSALEIFQDPVVAERVTVRARLALMLLFVLPLLVGTFFLGREVGGNSAGLVLVSAMAFSFSTLPYLSLITTDAAVAAATTFGVLAAIRWLRKGGLLPPLGLGLALGFGLVSKFSAVFLLPVYLVTAALVLRRRDSKRPWLSLLLPPTPSGPFPALGGGGISLPCSCFELPYLCYWPVCWPCTALSEVRSLSGNGSADPKWSWLSFSQFPSSLSPAALS
jgi:hypothetical protein